jgi:hypothetical protein
MLIMSCYTGFFNVRRGWQSLNTGPRFYLRLIRRTGWLWIYTSRTTDGRPFKPKKLSVPFLYPGVPTGLTPFRGLVPLGRRNLVPILPPAHPLGGGCHDITAILLKVALNIINQTKPSNTSIPLRNIRSSICSLLRRFVFSFIILETAYLSRVPGLTPGFFGLFFFFYI